MSMKSYEDSLGKSKANKLEENLQSIVNDLTLIMETLKFNTNQFENFEKIFAECSSLEEIIEAISQMIGKVQSKMNPFKVKSEIKHQTNLTEISQ